MKKLIHEEMYTLLELAFITDTSQVQIIYLTNTAFSKEKKGDFPKLSFKRLIHGPQTERPSWAA